MLLLLFLTTLIIASIEVQSSPADDREPLQDTSVDSADLLDDIPLEMEQALESVRQEDILEPVVEQRCLMLGEKCRQSKLSCCKTQKLKGGEILLTEGVCFLFGDGRCEARFNIPNYNKYLKLAKKVNKSNYSRLRNQYWKDLLSPFFYRALLRGL